MVKDNTVLDTFVLHGIPPALEGKEQVNIVFDFGFKWDPVCKCHT